MWRTPWLCGNFPVNSVTTEGIVRAQDTNARSKTTARSLNAARNGVTLWLILSALSESAAIRITLGGAIDPIRGGHRPRGFLVSPLMARGRVVSIAKQACRTVNHGE